MTAADYASKALNVVPVMISLGMAGLKIYEYLHDQNSKIKVMIDEGRGPTLEEMSALDNLITAQHNAIQGSDSNGA